MTEVPSRAELVEQFVMLEHELVRAKLDSERLAAGYELTVDAREDLESQAAGLILVDLIARVQDLQNQLQNALTQSGRISEETQNDVQVPGAAGGDDAEMAIDRRHERPGSS